LFLLFVVGAIFEKAHELSGLDHTLSVAGDVMYSVLIKAVSKGFAPAKSYT
jgi:hypothetical protein